jgi:hypothetical protein
MAMSVELTEDIRKVGELLELRKSFILYANQISNP